MTDRDQERRVAMPLLDHFHPPLAPRRHWESFHVDWKQPTPPPVNASAWHDANPPALGGLAPAAHDD